MHEHLLVLNAGSSPLFDNIMHPLNSYPASEER